MYSTAAHRKFRNVVLLKNEGICCACEVAPAAVADHWPRTRVEIVAAGDNPNDPRYGRPLCARCHNLHTAATSPGGWAARDMH